MCGRYTLVTGEEYRDFADIVNEVQRNITAENSMVLGEVYPTNPAPVLIPANRDVRPRLCVWGFPNFQNKGIIINARSETAAAKPLFRNSLISARCVVPSTGFFEWDKKDRQKYRFNLPDTGLLYMAGLVREFNGQKRFVILTTAANDSMREIHDRMPVVLKKEEIDHWLFDTCQTNTFLHRTPPELLKVAV
jgi:putative SOS response-associated peptidase YedK